MRKSIVQTMLVLDIYKKKVIRKSSLNVQMHMKLSNVWRGLPIKKEVYHDMRSAAISVAGKVFHLLLSWGHASLAETAHRYIQKTHTAIHLDARSDQAIQDLKNLWKGIIIWNHQSGVFSDYLPLFAMLWDEILKKTIFYTGAYSVAMNQREFPAYTFRPATLRTRKDVLQLKTHIEDDMQKIDNTGWYIFIIPSWSNTSEDAEFQAVFQRMITHASDRLPILVSYVTHNTMRWYAQIVESVIRGTTSEAQIVAKLQVAKDWKDHNGKAIKWDEMRKKYHTDMDT